MLYNQYIYLSWAENLLAIQYLTHILLEIFISYRCIFPDIPTNVSGTNSQGSLPPLINCGIQSLLDPLKFPNFSTLLLNFRLLSKEKRQHVTKLASCLLQPADV